jgi:AraC-like DNA-binding protein
MTKSAKVPTLRDRGPGTMSGPTIAVGIARGLVEFAVSRGANRSALAERSGVDLEALRDPDIRIPYPDYVALMRAAKALTGDPALALHFAEAVDLSELSIVGLLTHACETMLDAFKQIARYNRLVYDFAAAGAAAERFKLVPAEPGLLWLVDDRERTDSFPEAAETSFGWLLCGPRRFSDRRHCKAVHLTHKAPAYRAEYERIFRAPVFFESDRNALLIEASWVTEKFASRQGYAFGVLSRHAEALLESLERSGSFRGRVESMLMPVLHTGEGKVEAIAARLGVSTRTLQRRLEAEGSTFESALNGLRHKLALHYLEGERTSVNETAYLLGFSSSSAFARAFKRWTGHGPGRRRTR